MDACSTHVDHLTLPPNTSSDLTFHRNVAEFYYVINGQERSRRGHGRGDRAIRPATPSRFNSRTCSFENNSSETLDLMVVGISRDNEKRGELVDDALARRRNGSYTLPCSVIGGAWLFTFYRF